MKPALLVLFIIIFSHFGLSQDNKSLIGDDFSLENTLEVFKSSASLSAFEKSINTEGNTVNNLDLNEDGEIDFLIVTEDFTNDAHAIVISAIVSNSETQDVAVVEIEKTGYKDAMLQIVGDELLYGDGKIVEPIQENIQIKGSGPYSPDLYNRITVNVWGWPSVSALYSPRYIIYRSTWRWGNYPKWWIPRTPLGWRPIKVRFGSRYRTTTIHRVTAAYRVYLPKRQVSKKVSVKRTVGAKNSKSTVVSGKQTINTTNKSSTKKASKSNSVIKKGSKSANGKIRKTKKTKIRKTKK